MNRVYLYSAYTFSCWRQEIIITWLASYYLENKFLGLLFGSWERIKNVFLSHDKSWPENFHLLTTV
jgi:hypothetical protein